jgi:hypothetical protein
LYITPAAAVSFTVYEQFKQALKHKKTENIQKGIIITLSAGFSARILGTACRYIKNK